MNHTNLTARNVEKIAIKLAVDIRSNTITTDEMHQQFFDLPTDIQERVSSLVTDMDNRDWSKTADAIVDSLKDN